MTKNPHYVIGNRPLTKSSGNPTTCVICGTLKTRKKLKDGREETPHQYMRRKTCGNEWDGERYVRSDCLKKYLTGEGNPNYKGYLPTCEVCGKRVSYKSAKDMASGKKVRLCLTHSRESFKYGEYHDEIASRNKERGVQMKGIYPENLKPYAFKKGQRAWNKLDS